MSLDPIVLPLVERSLNFAIQQNGSALTLLNLLKNKTLRVRFLSINKQIVFVFEQKVTVLTAYDGHIDCDLALNLSTLPKLRDKANITRLIKENELQLDGDIDVAQQFSALLSALNFDIAEWLSQYTGDVAAHSIVSYATQGVNFLKRNVVNKKQYLSELVIEEWRLSPSALEVAYFADRVDDLQSQLAHIEQRFVALEKHMSEKLSD